MKMALMEAVPSLKKNIVVGSDPIFMADPKRELFHCVLVCVLALIEPLV